MGVDPAYEAISQTLLTMDPLPTINQAFARLVQAERQRKIAGLAYAAEEVNALAVTKTAREFYTSNRHQTEQNSRGPKKEYMDMKRTKVSFCRYCKKEEHKINFCYKLKNRQKRNEVLGNHNNFNKFASHVEGEKVQDHPLEGESGGLPQIDDNFLLAVAQKIMQLQHSQQSGESTSTVHLSNFAGINLLHSANISTVSDTCSYWIIDTGVTDHMSPWKSQFQSLKMLKQPLKIGLPDGTVKLVYQFGDVMLNPSLVLQDVLVVPEFKHNLLSVSKLLDHNNLSVHFDDSGCWFQDLSTKKVLARGSKHSGLFKINKSLHSNWSDASSTNSRQFSDLSFSHRVLSVDSMSSLRKTSSIAFY
ncbi:hypothetical protein RND81_13G029800 [Saponaria officinalis]|uniref:Retrovirus-related Pol polyprotein from transposon TNT 1-94-like beta-barrel domain-containing protein n=1 Tax=Saponaria officinalis TaxID=3572 RepID=A0AAW1GTD7_SAPOF